MRAAEGTASWEDVTGVSAHVHTPIHTHSHRHKLLGSLGFSW